MSHRFGRGVLGLPDIDGYAVARALRARPDGGKLSGFSQGTDRALSLAAGFDGHLAEPLPLTGLLDLLGRLERPEGV
ncbi:hypothetical protein [Streptomyces guryensis]|uniref:Response regulatory domain-containing protein n=1 Tax=Streptomyces guryensis TaxID=2886947 RepID=A0A9Q3VUA1_9ACTN|nr:hypothetical protein [Streptomyces guryensis]MCD9877759.1 hypothetical protein [Streptomyces guryensis]